MTSVPTSVPKKIKLSIKVSASKAEICVFENIQVNIRQFEVMKSSTPPEEYRICSLSVNNVYQLTSEEKTMTPEQRNEIGLLQKGVPFIKPFLANAIDMDHAKMLRSIFVHEEQYPEHAGHFIIKSDGVTVAIRCTHCNVRISRCIPSRLVEHACCKCKHVFLDPVMCPKCCVNWTQMGFDDVSSRHYANCRGEDSFNDNIDWMIAYGDYAESRPTPPYRSDYAISATGFKGSTEFSATKCGNVLKWIKRQVKGTRTDGPRRQRVIDAINYVQGKLRFPKYPYPLITIGEEIPEEEVSTP
jgi:hypothetical protein